MNRPNDPV